MNSREKILNKLRNIEKAESTVTLPIIQDSTFFLDISESKNDMLNLFVYTQTEMFITADVVEFEE